MAADQERRKITAQDKFADELGVLIRFLDPHLKTRAEAKPTDKPLWPWRKTIAFVLLTGLIGWSALLGVLYLLYRLWG